MYEYNTDKIQDTVTCHYGLKFNKQGLTFINIQL